MKEEKKLTLKELLDWCDSHHAEGKELTILWDGGNDSGWVHFQIDGVDVDCPEADQLVDMMYDQLDYGSWAGDFYASGTAYWNHEEKAFFGTDNYTETAGTTGHADIKVSVPKYIHFDDIEIDTSDEEVNTSVVFRVRNGFIHPEISSLQTALETSLQKEFEAAIDKSCKENGEEFDSAYANYVLERIDFKEEGDYLVATIKEVWYSITCGEDKDIEINLAELLEDETHEDEF